MPSKKIIALLVTALLITGCVTTSDSRFTKKADSQKALENYVALGQAYVQKGDIQKARKSLDRAADINAESPAVHNALASLWIAEDEPELAEEHFKLAIKYGAEFTPVKHRYGVFLYSQDRPEEACDMFKQASKDTRYERRAQIFDDLALCQYHTGKVEQAIVSYKKSLRLDGQNVTAMISLATLLYDNDDMKGAVRYFGKFQKLVDKSESKHNAQTLWLGIKLARVSENKNRESSFILQLKNRYPDSAQYKLYKETR